MIKVITTDKEMLDTEIRYLLNDIALNSSRASFKRLYLFYYGKLFSLAKSLVKQDELAEEITNDVFMNLWTRRASLPEINNFTYYCYTSVKNKSLTCLAKNQLKSVNIDDVNVDVADSGATGEDKLVCEDLTKLISTTLSKLSDQCRLVFKLIKEDGLKYREVADLLDISIKTVEYHMGNALKTLAQGLKDTQKTAISASPEKISKNI
ncbi:RNA polymerase sigma-70 factor [Mucilaginibacter rubeus]|uniref:RNA polymerase sigma-70 factor n=1 Tax=Mucilaginibacter rubeus TaxID=2027860 RepID=A0AAE6MJ11_9SPHI|nr:MULTISPECIES: RNA polymerase sigma-70 factor [Mucilaginibacter]QEM04732.1 RNA polymerase sigma-70 factor [Mucilaginibacter rubeus]QEM17326.1 RNA polymerase sigma-70 factor [Mucilaginibacter gossypii]QTE46159.1 RNA polymerase sigma-70 factor [Mucilaginibacter rubeus]QTE52757.1 RNA polymerase sigma-70 factor [Mucilaginibacter rubeus]QTE57844.1 RNA polymerase sigma-70 factor [Mucilaginibacter rubeus]